jgi:hypothetical protein
VNLGKPADKVKMVKELRGRGGKGEGGEDDTVCGFQIFPALILILGMNSIAGQCRLDGLVKTKLFK